MCLCAQTFVSWGVQCWSSFIRTIHIFICCWSPKKRKQSKNRRVKRWKNCCQLSLCLNCSDTHHCCLISLIPLNNCSSHEGSSLFFGLLSYGMNYCTVASVLWPSPPKQKAVYKAELQSINQKWCDGKGQ